MKMRTKLPRISVRPWTKDFLTSILGTTISDSNGQPREETTHYKRKK